MGLNFKTIFESYLAQMRRGILACSILATLSSCAMMDKLFDSDAKPVSEVSAAPAADNNAKKEEAITKYSDNSNMAPPTDRNYRHMTRARMEDESELGAQAGSMWMMDGQTSYLFTQNKIRREGDGMSLKLEGAGIKQVENKVGIIKSLLKKLEAQQRAAEEAAKAAKLAEAQALEQAKAGREPASESKAVTDAKALEKKTIAAAEPVKEEKEEKIDLKELENIPTRITERMTDGSYRVRGSQTMMIGKREYRVIATGIVRQEDFNETGVSSNKLLEPQFDVILVKRVKNEAIN